MSKVVWNTSIKELSHIIKMVGSSVCLKKNVHTSREKECTYLRIDLHKSPADSVFWGCDGYRHTSLMMPVSASDELDFIIDFDTLKAIVKSLKADGAPITVTLNDTSAEFACGKHVESCEIKEPKLNYKSFIIDTGLYDTPNILLTTSELLQLGGSERPVVSKRITFTPTRIFSYEDNYYKISWTVENDPMKVKGCYIHPQELCSDTFESAHAPHEYGVNETGVQQWSRMCLNYKYLRDALKGLPKKATVCVSIGKPNQPVVFKYTGKTEVCTTTVLPIVTIVK